MYNIFFNLTLTETVECESCHSEFILKNKALKYFHKFSVTCTVYFFQDLILEINELRYRMTELESEKLQYEKKLKSTKVSFQRNLCTLPVLI